MGILVSYYRRFPRVWGWIAAIVGLLRDAGIGLMHTEYRANGKGFADAQRRFVCPVDKLT